jgi:hypothetical protein
VLQSGCAHGAAAARHGRIERDPLARARPGGDDARELVAENERPLEHRVADSPFDEPVPVGAAETDRRDGDEELARGRLRVGLVVEAQVVRAVQA